MHQNILFLIISSWSFCTFSSHQNQRSSQPITIPDASWFSGIQEKSIPGELIIFCSLAYPKQRLLGTLNFEQTPEGTLYATNFENPHLRQKLGNFSDQKIDTNGYTIEWYATEARLKFPYKTIHRKTTT